MTRRGFTLVEVMVAMAVAALLLLALAGYVRASRAAHVAGQAAHEATNTLQLAAELLRQELLLAGSGPWPLPGAGAVTGLGAEAPAEFLGRGLSVSPVPGGHALGLVYLDDRLAGPPTARQLTFEAGVDGAGESQLYRRAATGARQPLVAGVERLHVAGAIDAAGSHVSWQQVAGSRVRALWIELHAHGEVHLGLMELPHRPRLVGP